MNNQNDQIKSASLWTWFKFLVPSLIGIFIFIFPINDASGELTVPVAFIANKIIAFFGDNIVNYITVSLMVLSALLTVFFTYIKKSNVRVVLELFDKGIGWVIVRVLGAIFGVMVLMNVGPEPVISENTGGTVLTGLIPTLFAAFLIAGFLLPLLLNYGLLEFVGTLLRRFMRPVFTLPGRSTVDNLASWVGDGTIGVLLTSKQYEGGFYTKREAAVIASMFSVVSITFTIVILDYLHLMKYFAPFYITVIIAGLLCAIILPRIPPLSKIEDTYYTEDNDFTEEIPDTHNTFSWATHQALVTAKRASGIDGVAKEGYKTVLDMWFGVLPVVMAIGTLGTIAAEYTPIFTWIGAPFVPLLEMLGIPDALLVSKTLFIGFTDMYLPTLIIGAESADMSKFIVAALSISQLLYLSEVGGVILGSKIPLGITKMFIIFLMRTAISLPIILIAAYIIF
ncbi:YjiH family protein [Phocicoccus pinnipedialis]|uniref:Nucleoside recognition n=1 Tax=Phocicoccus pinnipedialis TaxID=110845 RepID=A0A6V7RBK0_9BACL|nr:YjiH family protein [Jeotgalicoccus pinnipedialis]MBP1939529.1 nucleoside recognition membrane protein YjiH [Jeotgalicoccus pinnipedialis]CAD2075015.1 Nucleoside recognition [Jeotgalicoccus pinnipedialis]